MSIEQMRSRISKVYDSFRWRNRVTKMPDNQVIAIYHKFKESGKFDKPDRRLPGERYHQMTLFELGLWGNIWEIENFGTKLDMQ